MKVMDVRIVLDDHDISPWTVINALLKEFPAVAGVAELVNDGYGHIVPSQIRKIRGVTDATEPSQVLGHERIVAVSRAIQEGVGR